MTNDERKEVVRYCSGCNHPSILAIRPPALACCPDNKYEYVKFTDYEELRRENGRLSNIIRDEGWAIPDGTLRLGLVSAQEKVASLTAKLKIAREALEKIEETPDQADLDSDPCGQVDKMVRIAQEALDKIKREGGD